MESVQNTRRKISKLSISVGHHTLIRESATSDALAIVKKFSATIKHFELQHELIEMSDFLKMLSYLPNAEYLVFTRVHEKKLSPPYRQPSNECLSLHQLKTLELCEFSQTFLVVFNRLPAGVLKKLNISRYMNSNWNLLTGLFSRQSNIKELVLLQGGYSIRVSDHFFDHLRLESLELDLDEYNSSHATILSKQTKLIHLRLHGGEADDEILNVITRQLSELETLDIGVDEPQVVSFRRIEKLKKLKELTLETMSLMVIATLAGLDNSRITTLNMKGMYTRDIMPVNVVVELANSLRNLKILRINYRCKCQIIVAVMQHFNFLEDLEMRFDLHIDANALSQAIEVRRCLNPKLTELRITAGFQCGESVLAKLAADVYPNLKKLDISR